MEILYQRLKKDHNIKRGSVHLSPVSILEQNVLNFSIPDSHLSNANLSNFQLFEGELSNL